MPRGHAPSHRSAGKGRQDCPPSNFCPEFGAKASFHHREERKQAQRRGVIYPEPHSQEQSLTPLKGLPYLLRS